ncbi:hypothetical protein HY249_01745 [Candidatus Azambacteria bacterium]|nr:hypothetical protein [Candidatus Azambacteria bacterium]
MRVNYKNTSLISENEIAGKVLELKEYLRKLNEVAMVGGYDASEASINLPADESFLKKAKAFAKDKKTKKLKYVVVIGIGGSNLGTQAVYEAIYGTLNIALKSKDPKMIFLDTNNPKLMFDVQDILSDVKDKEEIVVNIISKSGSTTETVANFEVLYQFLKKRIDGIEERVVTTTDFGSKLWQKAEEKSFAVLEIPKNVGGRYSVFSSVGLFPLALCGVDVKSLLGGARLMRDECLNEDFQKNPALASAILTFLHYKKGANISNSFFFHSQLETIGRWYRQLMGESIGKEKDKNGNVVHIGITPIISIGSTDLHSMAQLFLGGPKDKFTTFVNTEFQKSKVAVPKKMIFDGLVEHLNGKDFSEIMRAIYEGVKIAYQKNKAPFMEIILPDLSESSIGQFLQFKMMEMIFLAELLNVNAFDQPNVEDYKKETKEILKINNDFRRNRTTD